MPNLLKPVSNYVTEYGYGYEHGWGRDGLACVFVSPLPNTHLSVPFQLLLSCRLLSCPSFLFIDILLSLLTVTSFLFHTLSFFSFTCSISNSSVDRQNSRLFCCLFHYYCWREFFCIKTCSLFLLSLPVDCCRSFLWMPVFCCLISCQNFFYVVVCWRGQGTLDYFSQ